MRGDGVGARRARRRGRATAHGPWRTVGLWPPGALPLAERRRLVRRPGRSARRARGRGGSHARVSRWHRLLRAGVSRGVRQHQRDGELPRAPGRRHADALSGAGSAAPRAVVGRRRHLRGRSADAQRGVLPHRRGALRGDVARRGLRARSRRSGQRLPDGSVAPERVPRGVDGLRRGVPLQPLRVDHGRCLGRRRRPRRNPCAGGLRRGRRALLHQRADVAHGLHRRRVPSRQRARGPAGPLALRSAFGRAPRRVQRRRPRLHPCRPHGDLRDGPPALRVGGGRLV